ncbi:MAG: 6-bladed beta-propeller [Flavisolibacter sp.]|nr:6-bladed beta-propeller [Flavisolibacter sp.]
MITGHHQHQYSVDKNWAKIDADKYPVNDCHEMVIDSMNRLYVLTNDTRNNILVFDLEGNLLSAWGTTYPGAHGLSLFKEKDVEYLLITDHERHQVIKTTLDGEEMMVLNYPVETGCYTDESLYLPTETAVTSNGDIYITDGYGLQYVIQYDSKGKYIRHWGGSGDKEEQFNCVHGIAIDGRGEGRPTLLLTSRNDNAFKRFSLEGIYLETISLPGSFVCRPVIKDHYVYAAVFRSGFNTNEASGFITILDGQNRVVSTPGGTAPLYLDNKLLPQQQEEKIFIHPHDVCVDDEGNIYVCQWKSKKTYPYKLTRIKNV